MGPVRRANVCVVGQWWGRSATRVEKLSRNIPCRDVLSLRALDRIAIVGCVGDVKRRGNGECGAVV